MSFIASALATVGSFFAGLGSIGCHAMWIEEPECPKSLIK